MLAAVSTTADDIYPCSRCEFDNDNRSCFDCFCLYCGNFDARASTSDQGQTPDSMLSECAACATAGVTFGLTRVHVSCHTAAPLATQVDVVCNACGALLLQRTTMSAADGIDSAKLTSSDADATKVKAYSVPNYLRALMCSDPRVPFEVLHCGSLYIGLQAMAAAKREDGEGEGEPVPFSAPHEAVPLSDEEMIINSLHSKPYYPMKVIKELAVETSPVDNQLRFSHPLFRPYRSSRRSSELWRTEGAEVVADGSLEGAVQFLKKTRESVDTSDEDFVKGLVRPHVWELMEKYGLRVKKKWEIISKKKRDERENQESVATKRKRQLAEDEVSTMYLFPTPIINARRHRTRDKRKLEVFDDPAQLNADEGSVLMAE